MVLRSRKICHLFSHSCSQIRRETCSNINQKQEKGWNWAFCCCHESLFACWCRSYLTFLHSFSFKGQNYSRERKSTEIMTSKWSRCVPPGSSCPFCCIGEEKGLFLRRVFEPQSFVSLRLNSARSTWWLTPAAPATSTCKSSGTEPGLWGETCHPAMLRWESSVPALRLALVAWQQKVSRFDSEALPHCASLF